MTTFSVLGPLRAANPLKGPRHRALLARLLVARGRVVPVGVLADAVWSGAPPPGALPALRTFVADLRRALEPDRPPRTPPRLLVTAPPGYALRTAPGSVDAERFEAALAGTARSPQAELTALDEALALWHGPAYAEWSHEPWARPESERLDELRLHAVERRAAALLSLGRPAEAASDLRAHAGAHPLREEAWRLLALSLYRSGRQGDALAALREVRGALVEELGIDPGPALRTLETDILAQSPRLTPPTPAPSLAPPTPATDAASRPAPSAPMTDAPVLPARSGSSVTGGVSTDKSEISEKSGTQLVGRDKELRRLRAAAEHGHPVVALVLGEAGAGKTALAEAFAHRLAVDGWAVLWGRAGEYEGDPGAWPWTELAAPDRWALHRAAAQRIGAAGERVLLVADDLHRADPDTLELLTALPPAVSARFLLLATARDAGPSPQLTAALARLARLEPLRIRLEGLSETATAQLARAVAERDVDAHAVHLLQERSGGNPFFIRELARLLAAEGPAALRAVPPGVRDVIRHRAAQLSAPTQDALRRAAVLGRDVDPELLAAMAGAPVLDALEEATRAGFLLDGVRFAHVLVRDTLYEELSAPRRAAWHTAAGEALERLAPHDVDALAHHFDAAGTRATAQRAARYAARAAERAERRGNPHEAARLWRRALAADVPDRLDATIGLGRSLAVIGHLAEARRLRAAAVDTAEREGDPARVAVVLGAFDVPAIWPRNDDEPLSARIAAATTRALRTATDATRARLLSALALELRGATGRHGVEVAAEADRLARADGDPALRALALNARFLHAFTTTGRGSERGAIAEELIALSSAHDLVTFEVLGHLIALQSACAHADHATAAAHAAEADALAERYALPVVTVFTQWYAAMRRAATSPAQAEPLYRAADARLSNAQMPGMHEGLLGMALLSIDRLGPGDELGPYEPWARPLLLLRADRPDQARAALHSLPPSPHDLLWEARLCLALRAAKALGEEPVVRRLSEELSPAAAEHAAGSGVLSFGAVAAYL
ncbi:BTAD domain-containing putative transcriptional regulator [Dactylosporangium sp. CA-233914]|uniref:BTAD domain-containing putative transcriptional regulator n=1 Tax=Dactylosporangium sp. CA-233914 TaxID=3239934 RepID=UPI003D927245